MDNIKCIGNLLNIEKNKSNNKIALYMIIDSFSSEISRDNIYYLYDKYIKENNENTYSNKKRKLI